MDAISPAGSWTKGKPAPEPRLEGFAAVAAGHFYYMGGITGVFGDQLSAKTSARVDIFDPATGSWSAGPDLPVGAARHHLAVAVVADAIYLLGGFTGILGGSEEAGKFIPNKQTWRLSAGAWTRMADQPIARGAATAQPIADKIYVTGGGTDENGAQTETYQYDPATDQWTAKAPLPTQREHLASCAVGGKMLVVGGWFSIAKQTLNASQIYDPQKDQWSVVPDLPSSRGGLGAAALGDTCYVIGGEQWHIALPGTFGVTEGFNVSTSTWQTFASMPTGRHGFGLVAWNGALYAIGGAPVMGNSYTDVVEVFTP